MKKKHAHIKPKLYPRQQKVLRLLMNFRNGITQVLYGGAAGGGKSVVGCTFILTMAIMFPGTRYLIGRSRLLSLKQTTLNTMFWLLTKWGLEEGLHYTYNDNKSTLTIGDSEILMKDLYSYPKDPDFDSLGSLEITAAFVDEGNQVADKAIQILSSRIRYRLKEFCDKCGSETEGAKVLRLDHNGEAELFECWNCGAHTEGLEPKMLITCNPAKNWTFTKFYKAQKEGKIAPYRRFIEARSGDNPALSKHYLTSLNRLDAQSRARLRDGDWEANDPMALFKIDPLADFFARMRQVETTRYFLAIDPAGMGKDAAELVVMSACMNIVEWVTMEGEIEPDELIAEADRLIAKWGIDQYDIAFDHDGLGWALRSKYEYAHKIVNNATPLYGEQYWNLKTQLYCRLARLMENNSLGWGLVDKDSVEIWTQDVQDELSCWTMKIEEELTTELQIIQRVNIDRDGKIEITSKAEIKQKIGRSPNKSDVLAYMMRHFLEDLDNSYVVL